MTVNHPVAGSSPANTAPFGDMIVDVIIDVVMDGSAILPISTHIGIQQGI